MGTDYSKGLYRQLEDALLRIDALTARVETIGRDTSNKYLQRIYELEQRIQELESENAALKSQIAPYEAETGRLRKIVNNDSSNSGTPPSRDVKPSRANTYNGRERSGKKPGGQPGRKGKTLRRFFADASGKAGLPREFYADVQYGNGLKALTAALWGQGIVASNRIVSLVRELTRGAVKMSEGTFYNFLNEFGNKSAKAIETIANRILSAPILGADETGARCESKNMIFRNYSTDGFVLRTVNETKGKKAIEPDNILPRYVGTLVHGHNTVNYNYGTNNAECNVHVLRYLRSASENARNTWALDMAAFFLMLLGSKKIAASFGLAGFDSEQLAGYSRRYDEIIASGFAQSKNTRSKFYRDEERRLLRRLRKYKANHLLFVRDFSVPSDNNLSERDLRVLKTKMKVSGSFRSLSGARSFAKLMSVIKTAVKQKADIVETLGSIFRIARGCLAGFFVG